jgi:hypothetical protein
MASEEAKLQNFMTEFKKREERKERSGKEGSCVFNVKLRCMRGSKSEISIRGRGQLEKENRKERVFRK